MNRRSILQLLATAAAALPWRGVLAQGGALGDQAEATLRAVAPAVLPSALGARGADAVVDDFLRWLRGYKSGADMGFGYGIVRKRVTPTITPAAYRQQLEALAGTAGSSFAALPVPERRRAIAAALEKAGVRDFPSRPDGTHVVSDFMSFYFTGSAANDLCHQAEIGRDKCRTLAGSSSRPAALN